MEDYQQFFVLNLLGYSVQKDVSAERLCTLSGLDLNALKKKSNATITSKQMNDLWLNASHLSNDPLFGLHLGESMQLAALGVVGQMILSSRTIGEALMHAAASMHLITDLFGMEVLQHGQTLLVRFLPTPHQEKRYPFSFRQMMDFCMVFTLHEVDGLVLEKIHPNAVTFPYEVVAPAEYERVLRCKPIQQADGYSMEFDARYLNEPILTANYELQGQLLKKISELHKGFNSAQPLKERIGHFVMANAYLGIPSLETIAANFNTSARSLQRKLQDEGVTYQQVADSIRKSLALHYLESGKYPVKEISYILGYNELSAFYRAFKRWTGTTPVSYQKG